MLENLIPEFKLKDVLQILIGASILAIPVGFTEETWNLGATLPWLNIIGLLVISLLFICTFVYYHYHRRHGIKNVKMQWIKFFQRVSSTYILSFMIVALLLAIIGKTPWMTDWAIAVKRTIIVTFPSSMSAILADTIK